MRFVFTCLILMSFVAAQGAPLAGRLRRSSLPPAQTPNFAGRWRVKFNVRGIEKNLIVVSQARGVATFVLLDTGLDNKPVTAPAPALWSQLTNDRVSFSGEVELPIGTCCREIGTLTFKGRFSSNDSISGKLVFITSVDDEESPTKLRSEIGTFTATRIRELKR